MPTHAIRDKGRTERPDDRRAPGADGQHRGSASKRLRETREAQSSDDFCRVEDDQEIDVVNFNVAGGSKTHKGNFKDETSDHLADNIIESGAEVSTLQEVKVDDEMGDFNQEILTDLAERQLPDGYTLDRAHPTYYDAEGNPTDDAENAARITYTASYGDDAKSPARDGKPDDCAGGTRRGGKPTHDLIFEIEKETVDAPLESIRPGDHGRANATVYTSTLDGKPGYSVVFGSSNRHGTYGNAVVLAPGCELARDAQGNPAVRQQLLGQDPDDGERRTAIGVSFTTPDGNQAHAVSTHMTNQKDDDITRLVAIDEQYISLRKFSESFGENLIVGGDFNSTPGEQDFPTAGELGLNTAGFDGIDHILSDGNIDHADKKGKGGSDHELTVAEVTI
ncbi:MAG: hypothetical protein FJX76_09670 [Armatimonadetes bacterium]|nr:hypothetical protein [Armatimonadota bacterium]